MLFSSLSRYADSSRSNGCRTTSSVRVLRNACKFSKFTVLGDIVLLHISHQPNITFLSDKQNYVDLGCLILVTDQLNAQILFNPAGFVIPDGCIILIQFYLGVLVLMYLLCLFCVTNFDVLLTVHLNVILVTDQLNAQIEFVH